MEKEERRKFFNLHYVFPNISPQTSQEKKYYASTGHDSQGENKKRGGF